MHNRWNGCPDSRLVSRKDLHSQNFDRPQCHVQINGERIHVLKIPAISSFPDCGTEQVYILLEIYL